MSYTKNALELSAKISAVRRIRLRWSNSQIQRMRDLAERIGVIRSPIDDKAASILILFVEENFAEAETRALTLLRDNFDLARRDHETLISFIFVFYAVQRFDILAALLRDRFGFNGEFSIDVEDDGPGVGRIRWEISQAGAHRFVFSASSFRYDKTRDDILGFFWAFPLYTCFSYSHYREHGSVVINQMDIGHTPGLAWCDNRPDYFLVPDCLFIPTRGYEYARNILSQKQLPWEDRQDIAFWRGGTTGIPKIPGDWRSLERTQLCEIAKRHEHLKFLDIGFSSILQMPDEESISAIKASGLMRDFVPWEQWGQFRYQIDVDGNSSPWSNLFQRLLTGSPVLKIESSRSLNQWYYDELVPWVNYIPVAPDMSDLIDKLAWLRKNQQVAREVGEAGRALALSLTYERELDKGVHTIGRAFAYFRGDSEAAGPFGRHTTSRNGT